MKKLFALVLALTLSTSLIGQVKVGPGAKVGGTVTTAVQGAGGGGGPNGFTAFKTITIDPTQVVGGSDLTNFPMLFSGTFAYLASTGSGGDVTDPQGDDIVFTSDSGCTTNLKFEQESWTSSTGAVNYWVRIPTLSTSSSTVIFVCYGKAAITTFQGDPENVWDSNYKAVYHMKEDPTGGAPQMLDSTANNNDLTANSGPTADSASQINGGLSFDGTASASVTQNASINGHSTITIQVWINPTTYGTGNFGRIVDKTQSSSSGFFFTLTATGENLRFNRVGAGGGQWDTDASSITLGIWASIALTYDYSDNGNDPIFYKNGTVLGHTEFSTPTTTTPNDSANDLFIGDKSDATRGFNGDMDELRFSDIIRSTDWIVTEHNNQSSAGTFYTVS